MKICCIIPARGGSKRLPRKNLLQLAGIPLVAHSVEHAKQSSHVQRVFVSTDDDEVASVSSDHGAEVIWRPAELATDTASSESALRHALEYLKRTEGWNPEIVVFLQCTSPVRRINDIDHAVEKMLQEGADSLFSGCKNDKFVWRKIKDGLRSLNYDYQSRPREQDFPEEYRENGSIYVFKPWVLADLDNRLGGKITVYEMDYWSSFQVDSTEDLDLCEWILNRRKQEEGEGFLPHSLGLVVFDFDGVFTDNRVLISEDGGESVWCNRSDSLGINRLQEAGISVLVLSTERNAVVGVRCRKMGVECLQGVENKRLVLEDVLTQRRIDPANVVYVGNDLNDLDCMRLVGCGIAVADAAPAVMDVARIVLKEKGGHGAVREACDRILQGIGARR